MCECNGVFTQKVKQSFCMVCIYLSQATLITYIIQCEYANLSHLHFQTDKNSCMKKSPHSFQQGPIGQLNTCEHIGCSLGLSFMVTFNTGLFSVSLQVSLHKHHEWNENTHLLAGCGIVCLLMVYFCIGKHTYFQSWIHQHSLIAMAKYGYNDIIKDANIPPSRWIALGQKQWFRQMTLN